MSIMDTVKRKRGKSERERERKKVYIKVSNYLPPSSFYLFLSHYYLFFPLTLYPYLPFFLPSLLSPHLPTFIPSSIHYLLLSASSLSPHLPSSLLLSLPSFPSPPLIHSLFIFLLNTTKQEELTIVLIPFSNNSKKSFEIM